MMEACTLTLYQKNIFRVTGLPVDATSKEMTRQVQKLQMLQEMAGSNADRQPSFALGVTPTTDEIRDALSRMKEPEHRIVDEFFWYWPEEFGASKSDPAIQAMLAGDTERAVRLWRDREKNGSWVARHNMAVMYHMFAVDWTNYHVSYNIDQQLDDQIKGYWRKSFERWDKIVTTDEIWDMLKERVRSLDDEVLTTGFIRRMLKQLPEALDRVNAEAALKLAEQGRMDWAKFHVALMRESNQGLDNVDGTAELVLRPTRNRVLQHLKTAESQVKKNPRMGAQLASQLMNACGPMMEIYDLFHGPDAHQRNELFDQVADGAASLLVSHQKATGDNTSFVTLLRQALKFASGSNVRERLMKNIDIGNSNVAHESLKPVFSMLTTIENSSDRASLKLQRIQNDVIAQLPRWASTLGSGSEAYKDLANTVAMALRNISIDSHNNEGDTQTALDSARMALKLANDADVIKRINGDLKSLDEILNQRKKWSRTISIRSDEFEISENFVRYNTTKIPAGKLTHISFGIFRNIVKGIESSFYNIGLSGGGQSIAVDCKRVFRSQDQAMQDFMAIIESLGHIIIPGMVKRLADYVKVGGNSLQVGPLLLTRAGLECTTGLLAWKNKHLVPYENLSFSTVQGSLIVSARHPANTTFALDRRKISNAVILESIVDEMKKR